MVALLAALLAALRPPDIIIAAMIKKSRSVSRVLSWTVIYLDAGLLPALKPLFVTHRANV